MRRVVMLAGSLAALCWAASASAQARAGEASRAAEAGRAGETAVAGTAGTSLGSSLTSLPLSGSIGSVSAAPQVVAAQPIVAAQPALLVPPRALECRMECDLDIHDCLDQRGASYWTVTTPTGAKLSVRPEDAASCGSAMCSERCE